MKIRTNKDIEKLDLKIKEELGIDVKKYRNEEVAENFSDLLVFPAYVINWVIRPILISVLIYIAGFFILNLVHVEYILYGIIGLILFIISGVLAGLLFLMWKMKSDMLGIINYSLDIMNSVVLDLNHVNTNLNKENRKDVLGLLFKGIIHIVTVPMISKIISNKVPFIGDIVNRIIKKILTLVADKINFSKKQLEQELNKKENESNILKIYSNSISSATTGIEKVLNFTFGVAKFPLKFGFGIASFILILFLYIIN